MQFPEHFIQHMPLELFVFLGTILDEIISPIPAFIILVPAGIAAQVQLHPPLYLLVLAAISAIARTFAGYLLYVIADKFEDILFAHGRRLFKTSHKDVENFGKRLGHQKASRSWLALFVMHALPVFPGTLLSMGSGFIRLRISIFLTATAAGSFVSAIFFLGLGYSGIHVGEILTKLDKVAQIITVLFIVIIAVWAFWLYRKKRA